MTTEAVAPKCQGCGQVALELCGEHPGGSMLYVLHYGQRDDRSRYVSCEHTHRFTEGNPGVVLSPQGFALMEAANEQEGLNDYQVSEFEAWARADALAKAKEATT